AVGSDRLLDLGVGDAGVVEGLGARLLHHVGVVPVAGTWLLELRHADPDDEDLLCHLHHSLIVRAALVMTGAPRSLVAAESRSLSPSRHIDVTIVSPGNTTPEKRAW